MAGRYSKRLLATAQPLNGGAGVLLVDRLVEELAIDKVMLELKLLLGVGVGENIDEFVSDRIVLEVKLEVVNVEDDKISLELESEVTGMLDGLVLDKETLELELLRKLIDVELMDVLDIGYKRLLELALLLDLEVKLLLMLPVFVELRTAVLSSELVGSLRLDDMVLTMAVCPEMIGVVPSTPEDVVELGGIDSLKMTMAKISLGEFLEVCASN
jgi:hypothetical protein